jgi:hypothetical protein
LDKLDALWTSWNGIRMACKASAIFSYKDRLQLAQCDPMAIRIKSQHTASGLIEIFSNFPPMKGTKIFDFENENLIHICIGSAKVNKSAEWRRQRLPVSEAGAKVKGRRV